MNVTHEDKSLNISKHLFYKLKGIKKKNDTNQQKVAIQQEQNN